MGPQSAQVSFWAFLVCLFFCMKKMLEIPQSGTRSVVSIAMELWEECKDHNWQSKRVKIVCHITYRPTYGICNFQTDISVLPY